MFPSLLIPLLSLGAVPDPVAAPPSAAPRAAPAAADGLFAGLPPMDAEAMRKASGGTAAYAVDGALGFAQTSTATQTGAATGSVTGSVNGAVTGNTISGNSGITTVFINTGNNVVLQSSVQVNVYTPVASGP